MNGSTSARAGQTTPSACSGVLFDGSFAGCLGPVHSAVRTASAVDLAQALQRSRAGTLGLMQAWQDAMPDLSVPPLPGMNPPLWEWGHIAWF
jgi:iron(II)-dependent oxidoreductase